MHIKDSIIGFAIGDAIGVPVEFKTRNYLENNKVTDMIEFGTHYQPKGTWSDDTSMVLATIDSLVQSQGINIEDILNKFIEWWKQAKYTATDKCFDIGIGTSKALYKWQLNHNQPSGSNDVSNNGNGSLMRILPIAFYCYYNSFSLEERIKIVKEVSSVTHAHDISCFGCFIYCEYVSFILKGNDKKTAYLLLKKEMKESDIYKYFPNCQDEFDRLLNKKIYKYRISQIKSSGYVVDTLEAVIWVIINTKSYKEAVLVAVNLGEDTDTIGALVGGLAGMIYGINNIPDDWKNNLLKYDYMNNLCNKFSDFLGDKKL